MLPEYMYVFGVTLSVGNTVCLLRKAHRILLSSRYPRSFCRSLFEESWYIVDGRCSPSFVLLNITIYGDSMTLSFWNYNKAIESTIQSVQYSYHSSPSKGIVGNLKWSGTYIALFAFFTCNCCPSQKTRTPSNFSIISLQCKLLLG
jgi:hypothetical protein